MSDDFIHRMLKIDHNGPGEGAMVVTELTPDFLARLAKVYDQLSGIHVTCRQSASAMGVSFTAGETYGLCSVGARGVCITVKNSEGELMHTHVPAGAVAEYFELRISRMQLDAINGLILDSFQMRRSELRRLAERLLHNQRLQVLDFVQWKPGMKNRSRPLEGEHAIVLERLDGEPIRVVEDVDSSESGARFDIVIGVLDDDGELLHFLADSRRFEKVEKTEGA